LVSLQESLEVLMALLLLLFAPSLYSLLKSDELLLLDMFELALFAQKVLLSLTVPFLELPGLQGISFQFDLVGLCVAVAGEIEVRRRVKRTRKDLTLSASLASLVSFSDSRGLLRTLVGFVSS
jgi:hypothetical protein